MNRLRHLAMNRLRHLPGVRWVLAIGGPIRVLRRATRAILDMDRALRRLTIAFERLDAALAQRTPEERRTHTLTSLKWLKRNGEEVDLLKLGDCRFCDGTGTEPTTFPVQPCNLCDGTGRTYTLDAARARRIAQQETLAAYKMGGAPDSVEPLNLEGWMQLHAKEIGWNGHIVEGD